MIEQGIQALLQKPGVETHTGRNRSDLADVLVGQKLCIPPAHGAVLARSNGLEVYWGYFRLFGVGATRGVDASKWNSPEYWKFAWGGRCEDYWCFGETIWGDQYAYSLTDLKCGNLQVHFLDALSMSTEVIADSFEQFFHDEFLRCAEHPYDEMIRLARQKLGPMDADSHLVYSPSPLLGGAEDIDNVQKMDARLAMICNGDVALQIDGAPDQFELDRLETFEDEEGRMRFRLIWS